MSPTSARHKRILLVDDNFVTQDVLSLALAADGYMVAVAANGQDAFERLQNCEPIDLILLDLCMPVMDGRGFREAQKTLPHLSGIPIIIFSGSDQAEGVAKELGAVGCLHKPVGTPELLETIRRCLEPTRAE
jgi:CheY-like chemotaxis protein